LKERKLRRRSRSEKRERRGRGRILGPSSFLRRSMDCRRRRRRE
jgi:hypothetical protein